jgi:hypothetical protein
MSMNFSDVIVTQLHEKPIRPFPKANDITELLPMRAESKSMWANCIDIAKICTKLF